MNRAFRTSLLLLLLFGSAPAGGTPREADPAATPSGSGDEPPPVATRHPRASQPALAALLRRFEHEPTVAAVQAAAVRYAAAHPERVTGWFRRVRRSAWLPLLHAGIAANRRRDQALDRDGSTGPALSLGAANQLAYEVKITWDLPRLIFDPNELKVSREAQRMAELRDQIVSQVTRLYFERRRLQLLELLQPASTPRRALERGLRIAELTALLDAQTGGIFRRRPEPGRRGARGRRHAGP